MVNRIILYFKSLNEKQILLLLIAMTFALRLYAVLMAQGIANDSAAYGFMARYFLKGDYIRGLAIPGHPLYPLLMALFSLDASHVEMAGRLLSLFFGTLTILPLFYLVKGAIGQREAILTALLYTFHPYLVTYSGMLLTEATYWGLLVLSVYFFWTGLKREEAWRMASSGGLLGLAYLTRPEGVGYVLVYLIWIAVEGVLKKKWLKKIVLSGVLTLSVFIFMIPYILYLHQDTGKWLISKKAAAVQSDLFKGVSEEIDPSLGVKKNKPVSDDSKILWFAHNIVQFLPLGAYRYLRAYHFTLWLFLFFGLIRIRKKVIPYELFLASLVLFHLFSLSTLLPSSIRFSIPVIPLSLFWAGTGILEMKRYLEKMKGAHAEKVIFLLVFIVILSQLPQSLKPERSFRAGQKEVGLWLKQNSPQDSLIMGNSPQEAFYAEREFKMLPLGISRHGIPGKSYDEIIEYARIKGVGYILIDNNIREMNPGFIEAIKSTDLKEIFRKEYRGIVIYKVIY